MSENSTWDQPLEVIRTMPQLVSLSLKDLFQWGSAAPPELELDRYCKDENDEQRCWALECTSKDCIEAALRVPCFSVQETYYTENKDKVDFRLANAVLEGKATYAKGEWTLLGLD